MSNRAKLFCAAVFFVLATVIGSERPDWSKIAYRDFSLEKDRIAQRVKLISRLIRDLEDQPMIEILPYPIQQLKQNMTASADEVRFLVDYEMNDPLNKFVFNWTECKRFFDEFEKEIDDVETRLDQGRGDAFIETIRMITDVLTAIKKELETVELVEPEARTCERFSCKRFVNIANSARRRVFELTEQFSCSKKSESTYIRILLQMEYNAFVKKMPDVIANTEKCIRGGNLSIQNHF